MKCFKTILLVLLSCVLASIATAKEDAPIDNKSTYHITDDIDLVSSNDIQYEKPKIMIKMIYPRLTSSNDSDDKTDSNDDTLKIEAFNTQVTSLIKEEISNFKLRVEEAQAYQQTLEKSKVKNRLTLDYNSAIINLEDQPIISIRFIMQGYVTGMKQPFRRFRTLNFDIDAGSEIQLADLFKPDSNYFEVMSEYADSALAKILRGKDGASAVVLTPENFNNWNINLSGIRITFDEATVAPANAGSQSILIPYGKLKGLINPDSALGRCLEHRTRCMRDHLLTGGFIDEAANNLRRSHNPTV
jgi:hypothetical protein